MYANIAWATMTGWAGFDHDHNTSVLTAAGLVHDAFPDRTIVVTLRNPDGTIAARWIRRGWQAAPDMVEIES